MLKCTHCINIDNQKLYHRIHLMNNQGEHIVSKYQDYEVYDLIREYRSEVAYVPNRIQWCLNRLFNSCHKFELRLTLFMFDYMVSSLVFNGITGDISLKYQLYAKI